MRFHPAHPDYHRTLFNSVLHDPLTVTAAVAAGASALQAAGSIASGNAQRAMNTNQAAQLAQQAGQQQAAAQRTAITDQRNTAFALSRAQALAASGGGNTADVGVANLEGNIAGQGEYNSLTALYGGNQKAAGLNMEAQDKLLQGRNAFQAGEINAGGSILKGASTLYSNYNNGGPPSVNDGFNDPDNLYPLQM